MSPIDPEAYLVGDLLPQSRAEWPAGVLEASSGFVAGDVISNPPLFYYADPMSPVWRPTGNYTDGSDGPEIVDANEFAPPFGMITTQTCDVAETESEPPLKPWVQVAPVYDFSTLPGSARALLKAGRGTLHLRHVPELEKLRPGFWAADFRIEVPVEKSILLGRQPIKGFASEQAQLEAVSSCARLRLRPAWADRVVELVQRPLTDALRVLRSSDRNLFDEINVNVDEVGAQTDSMLSPTRLQLALFVTAALSESAAGWWAAFNESLRPSAARAGIEVLTEEVIDLSECTVQRHRRFAPVPLLRYSPF